MDKTMIICCAAAFALSVSFSSLLMPLILKFCKSRCLFDLPNVRKIHQTTNIPRLAGVAFAPCVAVSVAVVMACSCAIVDGVANKNFNILLISTGVAVIFLAGLVDDIKGLHPQIKLVMQAFAVCVLPVSGLSVCSSVLGCCAIAVPFDFILTMFVAVYVINAINFIDGIDGLCGVFSILVMLVLLPFFVLKGDMACALVAAAVVGAVAAFLPYNLFGRAERGTKMFMGDTGSLTLGFIICTLCMRAAAYGDEVGCRGVSPKVISISLLALPMFDLYKVAIVRTVHHRNVFDADKSHIHHRLMAAGLSQHQSLAAIIALVALILLANCALSAYRSMAFIALLDILCMAIGSLLIEYIIKVRGKKDE